MFTCCFSKKILDNVRNDPPTPQPPPPPPTPPTSPPFNSEEIDKIKKNLSKMHNFNFAVNVQQGQIIDNVISRLHGTVYQALSDPGKTWSETFISCYGILAILLENPALEIGVIVIMGISNYLYDNMGNFPQNKDLELDIDAADLMERNTVSYNTNQKYLGYMYDDPNTYRDQEFSYDGTIGKQNKKDTTKYTLRDLLKTDFPDEASTLFNSMVELNCRQFKNKITIPEMIKMQYWDIYCIIDSYKPVELFGTIHHPKNALYSNWVQRSREFNKENVGNNVGIFANTEVNHIHPEYTYVQANGNDDNDLKSSYLQAINYFVTNFPSAFIHPWIVTNVSVYSCRWYLCEGFNKIPESVERKYGLANGEFLKWLFIDDGGGNVVNPNGVMYRHDILNSGILSLGRDIPDNMKIPDNENIIFKSTDYEYMYPGCSDQVTSNRVYTGDFYS